jgi:hypothetical protein
MPAKGDYMDAYYSLISVRPGHTLVIPTLTIIITENEARIQTTLGESVAVSRVDFMRMARWILKENDAESPDTMRPAA